MIVLNLKDSTSPLAEKIALKAAELSQSAPHRFISVFERLSALQSKELEPLLYILRRVNADPGVAATLDSKARGGKAPSTPKTPSTLSKSRSFNSLGGTTVNLMHINVS